MYEKFSELNGTHPWRYVSFKGYVDYYVCYRPRGQVIYFNYDLAREMELIPQNHSKKMTAKLEQIILKTFSLQIINEYDELNKTAVYKRRIKERKYMATRYLQLQHKSKTGKTSGDGRSIWNGCVYTANKIYDVSSCGTGVTRLSPGSQETKKPIKTGDDSIGYSCGQACLKEALSSALMSEIFYRKSVPTERVLAIIKFGNNNAIAVRAAPNLLRPAHMFRYLKSEEHHELTLSFNYFLLRQENNKEWLLPKDKNRYKKALEYFACEYAKLAAIMEGEYIFNWLAWDGDNMLATGAILDYGSIRQFAARHDKYRYDDVNQFSSSLNEQPYWCKNTVQQFIQVVDFIESGTKKNLDTFRKHNILKLFDKQFNIYRDQYLLWRIGFSKECIDKLLISYSHTIKDFRKYFEYFEKIKVSKGQETVADGIDHPPVFLVRHILRELPKFLLKNLNSKKEWPLMRAEIFCELMAGSYVRNKDLLISESRLEKINCFQKKYIELILACDDSPKLILQTISDRAEIINYEFRCTGDGIITIIDEAVKVINKLNTNDFQKVLERFIESQTLIPGKWQPFNEKELSSSSKLSRIYQKFQGKLELYNDLI